MLRSVFKLFVRLLGVIVPVRIVSTFCGIGHLPAWQEHWASFASLFVTHAVCYIIYGSFPPLADAVSRSGLFIATFFLQVSLCILVLGIISIFIVLNDKGSGISHGETIVVQNAFGQMITASVSMPATIALYEGIAHVYNGVCAGIFMCPVWFNYFMHLLVFFVIPFIFFSLVTVIKPWPISMLQLRYSNCFSVMMEGLVLAVYALIVMYMLAFISSDLRVMGAIKYLGMIFRSAFLGVF